MSSNNNSDSNCVEMQTNLTTTIPKGPSSFWKISAKYCIMTFCCLNVIMLFIGGLWPALTGYSLHDHKEIVIIHTDKLVHNVSDKFLSIALDSSLIQKKWDKLDFRSTAVLEIGKALYPCYLRVGGTAADRLIFEENDNVSWSPSSSLPMDGGSCSLEGELCSKHIENFTMSGQDFIAVNLFANSTGMTLLFDLNVLLRKGNEWDDTNAHQLIKFATQNNFKIAWQLGNEPNAFRHVFHETIPASQLGLDLLSLRRLLNQFPLYEQATLVGPDVTKPRLPEQDDLEFLREFLREAGPELDAVTWHQYYLNGREAALQDFLNVETFNKLYEQISMVKKAVRNMALNTPIWLGETGSAFGGGAPELSDRFVAGFLWLDKLGVSASQGINVVVRQSFYGGHYALIKDDLRPTPDLWLSVLHKKLVGRGVIGVSQLASNKGQIRIYCHCTHPQQLIQGLGAVTVFGLNLQASNIELSLQGTHNVSSVHRYILQGETGLQSRHVLLNGVRLELLPNGSLPPMPPQPMDLSSPITLPAHSMGFWVLHGAQVPACQAM